MTKVIKKGHIHLFIFPLALILFTVICCSNKSAGQVKQYSYKILAEYPHDVQAYTQGLFIHQGILYESTGQYGQSSLRRVDLKTGRIVDIVPLLKRFFAEGACVLNDKIYLLTWQEQTVLVFDLKTLRQIGEFRYQGEGWGLTTDGKHLIMSDGSSSLRFMNPDTFAEVRHVNVTYKGSAHAMLNELEYIEGEVWANVYTRDYLLRINPENGTVTGIVYLNNILPAALRTRNTDVLNGIAYDAATKKIVVTGKNWPKLYEIAALPMP